MDNKKLDHHIGHHANEDLSHPAFQSTAEGKEARALAEQRIRDGMKRRGHKSPQLESK